MRWKLREGSYGFRSGALDPIAEADVYKGFGDVVGDKTAIFISHRLSSCSFCDNIAVFHESEMIQYDSHDELVIAHTDAASLNQSNKIDF